MLYIPNGYAQCRLRWHLIDHSDKTAVVTYGIDNRAGPGAATLANQLWAAAVTAGSVGATTATSTAWTLDQSAVSVASSAGPVVAEYNSLNNGAAAIGTPPISCCVLAKKVTNLGGRKMRGRLYFPPVWVPEENVDEQGVLDSSLVSDIQDLVDTWKTYINVTLDLPMVLFHNDGVTTPTSVQELVVESTVATQRRRLRR